MTTVTQQTEKETEARGAALLAEHDRLYAAARVDGNAAIAFRWWLGGLSQGDLDLLVVRLGRRNLEKVR